MMKEIWITKTCAYNGTITMFTGISAYATEDLAKETAKTIDEANKDNEYYTNITTTVEKVDFYETREDVPILEDSHES